MTQSKVSAQSPSFILFIFTITHILLSFDRSVISILAESLRQEFHLSDRQLGLLAGSSFALAFGLAGLPLGYLADRLNRRNLLVLSIIAFSGVTALASQTATFGQLVITRMIVGVGEAGCGPAMISMLADRLAPQKRAGAMAIYYTGVPLGAVLAFLLGGAVAAHWGWRSAFLVAGLPGLFVALFILFMVREPERTAGRDQLNEGGTSASFGTTILFIAGQRSLVHILLACVLTSAATSGILTFAASYFIRIQGLPLTQVGLLLAVFYGAAGVVGGLTGGRLVDRLARDDERWRVRFCAWANWAAAAAVPLLAMAPEIAPAVAGLGALAMLTNATYGPVLAALQSLVGGRMRGVLTSIYYLCSFLVGAGSGPLVVGGISDAFQPLFAEQALRYALLIGSVLYIWGGLHLMLAARRYADDMDRAAMA